MDSNDDPDLAALRITKESAQAVHIDPRILAVKSQRCELRCSLLLHMHPLHPRCGNLRTSNNGGA
eukprot:5421852-Alexandrium_andersonii.AAC.1